MRSLIKKLSRVRARMRKEARSGSAAIEFAFVAPVLFLFLLGIIETGVLFFASSALQNATDDTARLIRTGQLSGTITASVLKSNICSEVVGLISTTDCNNNLQIDLRSYSGFSGAGYPSVVNANGSLNTSSMAVQATGSCQVVLMRSFYPWTIMTPMMAPLLENMPSGKFLLTGAAAFRTEPYVSGTTC
jgi:Flp pilus assembly protein TadG